MSAYQMVVRTVGQGIDLDGVKARFWRWWLRLYADPPRRPLPYI